MESLFSAGRIQFVLIIRQRIISAAKFNFIVSTFLRIIRLWAATVIEVIILVVVRNDVAPGITREDSPIAITIVLDQK